MPTIQGSSEGRTYTIKSITPEISGFTIDAATGKISIAENTLTQIGNVYEVDVTVTNEYGTSDFPKAYIVTVVDLIRLIRKHSNTKFLKPTKEKDTPYP